MATHGRDRTTAGRDILEDKVLPELQAIASSMGVQGYQRLRKADLIGAIIAKAQGVEFVPSAPTRSRRRETDMLAIRREALHVAGRDCVPPVEPAELEIYAVAAQEDVQMLNSLVRLLNLAGGHERDIQGGGPSQLGEMASGTDR
jgi:hypothetical protein